MRVPPFTSKGVARLLATIRARIQRLRAHRVWGSTPSCRRATRSPRNRWRWLASAVRPCSRVVRLAQRVQQGHDLRHGAVSQRQRQAAADEPFCAPRRTCRPCCWSRARISEMDRVRVCSNPSCTARRARPCRRDSVRTWRSISSHPSVRRTFARRGPCSRRRRGDQRGALEQAHKPLSPSEAKGREVGGHDIRG